MFRIVRVDADIPCGGKRTPGCFKVVRFEDGATEGRLYFNGMPSRRYRRADIKEIMQHEACHAILWKLGDSRWAEYGRGHTIPPVAKKDSRLKGLRLTPGEGGPLFRALGWTSYGLVAGDLVTTEIALRQPGNYEVNPLQRNRAVRIGSHVAFALFWNHVSESFHARGRRRTALWMRIASVVAYGVITARNIHVARGQ